MSYTFDLASATPLTARIAAVRDEIDDVTLAVSPVEGADYFLSDARITRRLTDATVAGRTDANIVRMAAASALDTLATNQAYVLKVGKTLGEERDGAKVADGIRAHAKALRAQVKQEEDAAAVVVDDAVPPVLQGSSVLTRTRVW